MFETLPDTLYNSILVVNALNGALPLVLREAYPDARIVCGEVFPFFHEHLRALGFEVVEWDKINMKFDLVIGNPPYQSPDAKKVKLWFDILQKTMGVMNHDAHLCFVTPNSWLNQDTTVALKTRSLLLGNELVHVQPDASKWFNVGESICYFIAKCPGNGSYSGEKIFENEAQEAQHHICEKMKASKYPKAKGILRRVYHSGHPKEFDTYSPIQTSVYTQAVAHSSVETWFTSNDLSNFLGHNIIINNSGYYYHSENAQKYIYYSNCTAAGGNAFQLTFPCKTHALNCLTFLQSKLYRFFVEQTKSGGFNATALYQLPILDSSNRWDDLLVYKAFNLTDNEIALVESSTR